MAGRVRISTSSSPHADSNSIQETPYTPRTGAQPASGVSTCEPGEAPPGQGAIPGHDKDEPDHQQYCNPQRRLAEHVDRYVDPVGAAQEQANAPRESDARRTTGRNHQRNEQQRQHQCRCQEVEVERSERQRQQRAEHGENRLRGSRPVLEGT